MSNTYTWEAILSAKDQGLTSTIKAALSATTSIDNAFDKLGSGGGRASDALSGVGSAAGKSEGLLSKFKSAVSFGSVFTLAQQGMQALTGGIGSLVSETANASDSIDKFKSTMDFAGFTKKQTAQATKAMKTYADQTVYDLGDVLNTTAQLAANGVPGYQKLTKAAGNLNAVAGGNADTFKSVAMVMTQTAGAGKLTTENWNQLADAIPGASGVLQAAMKKNGAYTGNFRDAMAAGQITADEFNKAISQTGMTKAAQEAATSTATFEGALGNLQAAFVSAGITVVSKFKKPLTDAMAGLGTLVTNAGDAMGKGIDGAIKYFSQFGSQVSMIMANFKAEFSAAFSGLNTSGASKALTALKNLFTTTINTILGIVNVFVVTAGDTFGKISQAFTKVFSGDAGASTINALGQAVQAVGGVIMAAFGAISQALQAIPWEAVFSTAKAAINTVLPVITAVANVIAKALSSKAFQGVIVGVAAAVAAFKTFKEVITIITAVKKAIMVLKVVGAVAKDIQLLQFALSNMAGASKIAAAAQWVLNAAMDANPIGIIITAIAALVAGLVWFFTQTKTGQAIWASFVAGLVAMWQGLVATATTVWTALSTFFTNLWNGIVSVATTVWTTLTTTLSTIWNDIIAIATPIFTAISTFFTTIWTAISTTITTIWTTITSTLSTIWNGIVAIATGVWGLLKAAIMGPILIIIDLLTANWSKLGSDLSLIWNSIVSAATSIWNGLMSVLSGIWNGIKGVATAVFNGLKAVIIAVWNAIKSVTSSVWNGIKGVVSGVWNGLKSLASGIFNGIKSVVTGAFNGIKSGVIAAAQAMSNGAKAAWNTLTGAVRSVVNGVKSAFSALGHINLAAAGKAIMNGFLNGLKSIWGGIQNFVGGIASWIRKHKGPISYDRKLLIPAGTAIMTGLNEGLEDKFGAVKSNVAAMAGEIADAASPDVSIGNISGSIADANRQLQRGITADVSGSLNYIPQPAEINLGMGTRTYTAYVDDISTTQDKEIALSAKYRLK